MPRKVNKPEGKIDSNKLQAVLRTLVTRNRRINPLAVVSSVIIMSYGIPAIHPIHGYEVNLAGNPVSRPFLSIRSLLHESQLES